MADWPHAPLHRLSDAGAYMVTAATDQKKPLFHSAERLKTLCQHILDLATVYGWKLQAWAVFPNHYHFIGVVGVNADNLARFVGHVHAATAKQINGMDGSSGRKVWFQYWDSHITFPRSYLSRLNYVHCNAVKHGVVRDAGSYVWCSAGWFERTAEKSFYRTVMGMRSDRVNVLDDFEVDPVDVR
jgi:putative transposase